MSDIAGKMEDRSNMRRPAIIFLLSLLLGVFISLPALASGSGGSTCAVAGSGSSKNCDGCIDSFMYQNINSGNAIITAIFTTINNVLQNVEYSFFNGIVSSSSFQSVIGTGIVLYVAMYGMMIMLNLTSYRIGEVANRLIKVAFVYMLTAPGAWSTFNTWVQTPVIGATNQMIKEFNVVAEGGTTNTVVVPTGTGTAFSASGSTTTGLDPVAFSNMFGSSLTTVFSAQLFTAIMAMMKTGFFGWLVSLFLIWALIEFALMMLGAIFTYAKAIIGLAFLFSIGPLFIIFLLFEKTRDIFWAWTSHVLTFALQPVILFAFLAFYVALINQAAPLLLTDDAGTKTNYCWVSWFSMPGTLFQPYFWAPTSSGHQVPGSYNDINGNVLPSPINVPNAVYFLMLCYLAKTFTQYVETLANTLGEGVGPGVTTGRELEEQIGKLWGGAKGMFKK